VHAERGFFGVHRVEYWERGNERYHALVNGSTLHGMQSLTPDRQREPLTYYHRTGPIGQVFDMLQQRQKPQDVAVLGLGVGSLACYNQPGQRWTFYEIDPQVVQTARDPRFFTLLRDCAPTARIVLGDGRLSLTRAEDQQFDLIVLDAYSSDSIPLHLATRESLALYLQKLAPRGLLAYHISNRYVNIRPVLANLALDAGLESLVQLDPVTAEQAALGKTASEWIIMARERDDFGELSHDERWQKLLGQPGGDVWTDDFSSITSVLRFR
jgi:spermidine synthase